MRLFFKQKWVDISVFPDILDDLIQCNIDDVAKVEQAYKLKTKCLSKTKRNDDVKNNNNNLLADYYLKYAEKLFQKNDFLKSESYYKKGIKLYCDNGEADQAKIAHKRLVEIQKEIPKTISPFSVEIDIKDVTDNLKVNMEGLSFEECVIRMIHLVSFERREDIKKCVLEELKDNPISYLIRKEIKNKQGQTVFVLPSLDMRNPEKDSNVLESYMFQNALRKQEINGDVLIKNALNIIRNKFKIDKSMAEFLVKDNLIIPDGRAHIFQSGLYMFLNGDYYEALHILAPQIENLFRNIAGMAGGLTENLQKDGSSMEKSLSSVLSSPELMD